MGFWEQRKEGDRGGSGRRLRDAGRRRGRWRDLMREVRHVSFNGKSLGEVTGGGIPSVTPGIKFTTRRAWMCHGVLRCPRFTAGDGAQSRSGTQDT